MLTEINHCPNFHIAARSKFPELRGPTAYTYIARALCTATTQRARAYHVHCALCHETTCIIELRSLNSISVPNLVSISKNFLEPEDPSRINFSGLVARSLHPTRTATTKTYILGKHACDLQVWHQRCIPSGL